MGGNMKIKTKSSLNGNYITCVSFRVRTIHQSSADLFQKNFKMSFERNFVLVPAQSNQSSGFIPIS